MTERATPRFGWARLRPEEAQTLGTASIAVDETWEGWAVVVSAIAGVEIDRVPAARLREALIATGCDVDAERVCAGIGNKYVFLFGIRDGQWVCVLRQRRVKSGPQTATGGPAPPAPA